jgi:hypothetical protein
VRRAAGEGGIIDIERDDIQTCRRQVSSHWPAHDAEADESYRPGCQVAWNTFGISHWGAALLQ